MAENVVVKTKHERVRFIRYDSGETLFIVKGANRKRSYMTGDNPTVKKLLASACEGEKIPIKAGIIRKLTIGPNPSLSHDKLNKMVEKIAGFWKKRYIVFYGLHAENDITGVPIYHIHMMVSLSNYETGKKGDITPNTISKFQRKAKRILLKTLEKGTHNKSSGE